MTALVLVLGMSAASAAIRHDLPLGFEPNQGQTAREVRFLARGTGYTVFLTETEAALALHPSDGGGTPSVVRLRLIDARATGEVIGLDALPGRSRYFVSAGDGRSPASVPTYRRVRCRGVYPGIDVEYYGNRHRLEHDFIVAPGADPAAIRIALGGIDDAALTADGDLDLSTPAGGLRLYRPFVYQEVDGTKVAVEGRYVVAGASVGFAIGRYDKTRPLVIDPVLSYSVEIGGSGYESGYDVAIDKSGNAYVTGATRSVDFPTLGAVQAAFSGGNYDAFALKLNADATEIVYSTFLGGGADDTGHAIAVDAAGVATIAGATSSSNFYPALVTLNAFQHFHAGAGDAFVVRLDEGGGLVYGTYLGGSQTDAGFDVALDDNGVAYITGHTFSTNFPTVAAFQSTLGGTRDAFVAKVDPSQAAWNAQVVYSTYLGGSGQDDGFGVGTGGSPNAYVTGQTCSDDFPRANRSPLQNVPGGHCDAFVAKLNELGSDLVYSTYLGGSGWDKGNGIAVNAAGEAHVAGETTSLNFPDASQSQVQNAHGGGQYDGFVARVNSAGSKLGYSTYLGGAGDDYAVDVSVNGSGIVYTTGYTNSETGFPLQDALQPAFGGGTYDAFVSGIDGAGTALVHSTYLGGKAADFGMGVAVDGEAVYVTGHSLSAGFPTTHTIAGSGAPAHAYIASFGGGTVSVIDTSTQTVIQTIPVGNGPGLASIAVSPGGTRVFAANTVADRLYAIDPGNFAVTSAPMPNHPKGLAVHPNGNVLYVGNSQVAQVTAVHTGTLSTIGTRAVGDYPAGLVVSPDGTRLYVANGNDGDPSVSVVALDPITGEMLPGVPDKWEATHAFPTGIAVTPDGQRVYVSLASANGICMFDVGAPQACPVDLPIATGAFPQGMVMNADGTRLYVANQQGNDPNPTGNSFTVVNTDPASPQYHVSQTFTSLVPGGPHPVDVSLRPDGQVLYVVNNGTGSVSVVETATNAFVDVDPGLPGTQAIVVGTQPHGFQQFVGPPRSGGEVFVTRITPAVP